MESPTAPADSTRRRTALVTGANRGIGYETCRELARAGFDVLLTSRDAAKGRAAAERLTRDGFAVTPRQLDLDDPASIRALADELAAAGTTLDVLVNNAAVLLDGEAPETCRRTLATNFFGTLALTDALLPLVPDGGHVVMVSSEQGQLSCLGPSKRDRFADPSLTRPELVALVEGFLADAGAGRPHDRGADWPTDSPAYRVSKVGLNAFTRLLAKELSPRRVRVTAVCPGWCRSMGGPEAERSVEQGAASVVWAAAATDGPTGGFFRDGAPLPW